METRVPILELPQRPIQGGYNVSKPWAKMSTEVKDLESGRKVWVASSQTGGNAYASFNTIRKSYCKKIADELQKAALWEVQIIDVVLSPTDF